MSLIYCYVYRKSFSLLNLVHFILFLKKKSTDIVLQLKIFVTFFLLQSLVLEISLKITYPYSRLLYFQIEPDLVLCRKSFYYLCMYNHGKESPQQFLPLKYYSLSLKREDLCYVRTAIIACKTNCCSTGTHTGLKIIS